MTGDEDDAYDIYLLRLSGVPIFAGCTGSDYCTEHINNHEMHGAFLSAIYTFSKGVSTGTTLKSIVLDTIQINIKVDEPNDLMIALVHPKEVDAGKIRLQMEAAHDLFLRKYKTRFEQGDSINEEQVFREFERDLREEKIIHKSFLRSVLGDVAKPMQMLKNKLTAVFRREE
jgi:hypothetical protein